VNKDDELARLPLSIRNQGSVANDLFFSPGKNVCSDMQDIVYPLLAGF
jgi:hypothetical protein